MTTLGSATVIALLTVISISEAPKVPPPVKPNIVFVLLMTGDLLKWDFET